MTRHAEDSGKDSTGRSKTAHRIPHVAHVIDSLRLGGMENGLVNLINHMPPDLFRHTVICLTGHDGFAGRIARDDVPIIDLHKRPGKSLGIHARLWRTFRAAKPDIVHTRNLSALEAQIPAAAAGVRCRVHGEHGREIGDLRGTTRRSVWIRRLVAPFVHTFVPMSRDLEQWLRDRIGVEPQRIAQVYNGVDASRFQPPGEGRARLPHSGMSDDETVVIGSVGRMDHVKDQLTLVRAFLHLLDLLPRERGRLRLVHVGDGALMPAAKALLSDAGATELAWLPGTRDDVPAILRGFDIFVLPSLGEGISNTILEAMATGLPVVATRVGGNPELVVDGETGSLVEPGDAQEMAGALRDYVVDPERRKRHGRKGRRRVEEHFSIDRMVQQYVDVYASLLARKGAVRLGTPRPGSAGQTN